uniref:Uncharacterized protein n=1 Tax=Pseudictyota dubia TaxID=2749911 RepID=A0A7R9ZEP1_9STRA
MNCSPVRTRSHSGIPALSPGRDSWAKEPFGPRPRKFHFGILSRTQVRDKSIEGTPFQKKKGVKVRNGATGFRVGKEMHSRPRGEREREREARGDSFWKKIEGVLVIVGIRI